MAIDLEMNVLIVDDYSTMLRIIKNLLNQIGFKNVVEAKNGQEAIERLKDTKIGLVISDWNMEPMSGLDLLKHVRATPETSKLPFIMVTAESKTENVMIAKEAGVSNYIVKPFNAATLKQKIVAVLGEF